MIRRREFLTGTGGLITTAAALGVPAVREHDYDARGNLEPAPAAAKGVARSPTFSGVYSGDSLNQVAFPLGGIGAGMICLEGAGALSGFSLRHRPDLFNEPSVFAALSIRGSRPMARVLEGPVPKRKLFGMPGASNGVWAKTWGLPRFKEASFQAQFPFAFINLADPHLPLSVELTGWSPFEPGNSHDASLPLIALEYGFHNNGHEAIEGVFSFNSVNFVAAWDPDAPEKFSEIGPAPNRITSIPGGFVLQGSGTPKAPWLEGSCALWTDDPDVKINHAWLRSSPWTPDALRVAWREIEHGACFDRPPILEGTSAPGATLFVPFSLAPGQAKTVCVRFAWYVAHSDLRVAVAAEHAPQEWPTYKPWYAERFADLGEVVAYWNRNYTDLRLHSRRFSECLFSSTLPAEVMDAVSSNLSILKSPTLLREASGRLWAWEGSGDTAGDGGPGSCTHVWNYAQAVAHLLPDLERSLRETEFGPSLGADGFQSFRAVLPIRPIGDDKAVRTTFAAADGQLGSIIRTYREWRISGDSAWLAPLWPKILRSLDYCIRTWDPKHRGVIEEPHLNTYDVQFWGPDGMHASLYLGALEAAIIMGRTFGEDVTVYRELLRKGTRYVESTLFNGEYFIQDIEWSNLRAKFPAEDVSSDLYYSPESLSFAQREGPRYQYGHGCLADGVFGQWLSLVCGLDQALDENKVKSHVKSVYSYNLKHDLSQHVNPHRATLACGGEGGLVLCTWPKGHELTLPFPYCDEVWTGVEYQAASHLILMGFVEEGLDVVRTCRGRYDGRVRNPFDEYECGHWYGRALASYALLQALSGARYDAVDRVLYLRPKIQGDFRCFISTSTGYGTVGVREGEPFVEVVFGTIPYTRIEYKARRFE